MDVEAVAAEGLACRRGAQIIVSDLSFEVPSGTALLLKGSNGSGKTTLLRTLAGFLTPAAGHIKIRTADDRGDREHANYLHYIGHTNGVKPRLSVLENMSFWQRYYGEYAGDEAVEGALDAFGLLHLAEYRAAHLSQGQTRRLGLARLLAAKRPVWLLDEPSVSLDTVSTRMLEATIASHLSEGGLAIIATHGDLSAPRAAILHLSKQPVERTLL